MTRRAIRTLAKRYWVSEATSPPYATHRTEEGLSRREIVRCIKCYLARHLFPILIADRAELT